MNWESLDNYTIKSGYTVDGVKFSRLFLQDFNAIFGLNVNIDERCGACIDDYIAYYRKNNKMQQESENKGLLLELDARYDGTITILKKTYSVESFTNKDALEILENHPLGFTYLVDFLEKFPPTGWDEKPAVEAAKKALKELIEKEGDVIEEPKRKYKKSSQEDSDLV